MKKKNHEKISKQNSPLSSSQNLVLVNETNLKLYQFYRSFFLKSQNEFSKLKLNGKMLCRIFLGLFRLDVECLQIN